MKAMKSDKSSQYGDKQCTQTPSATVDHGKVILLSPNFLYKMELMVPSLQRLYKHF